MKRILMGFIAAGMGGALVLWTWNTTSRIRASESWPTTIGEVVQSRVVVDSSRIRGGGYNLSYRADVRYRYEVAAKIFESSTFTFGVQRSFVERAQAESEVALYPVGRNVQVYFDRSEPATSCLLPGTVPRNFDILLRMSLGFLVAGVASVSSGIYSRRNQTRGIEA